MNKILRYKSISISRACKWFLVLLFFVLLNINTKKNTEIISEKNLHAQSHELAINNEYQLSRIQAQNNNQPTKTHISWKLVYYHPDFYHLYVSVNKSTEYYVGYIWGPSVHTYKEKISKPDVSDSALTLLVSLQNGDLEMFYIYPKSEKELALMHRKTPVGINPEKWSSYKEIMSIPIVSSYKIQIDDPIITHYKYGWFDEYAAIVYDGILIGGLYNRREKLLSVSDYDFDLYYLLGGNRGFRLFDNGQYVGTTSFGFEDEWLNGDRIHVDLQHNGAPFNGLGINLPDPDVRVCEKTYLDTSAKLYQNYIAQILSDSGLENAPVNITEVIGSDVTEKGSEDILIIADNSTSKKLTSTNYSLGVMFTKTENGVEFTRLFMDANTCSSAEANNDSDYEYEICEIVDFDCNGVCEIVVKRKSDKENAYQIYEFVDYGKEKAFILRTERIVQA